MTQKMVVASLFSTSPERVFTFLYFFLGNVYRMRIIAAT